MDSESKYAAKFLEAIASNNRKFIKLAGTLRSQPNVLSVKQGIDCRQYDSGTRIEYYADAELREGKSICWWLEIIWNKECWTIEASVLISHDQGQDKLKEFPDRISETFNEFITQFNESTDELIRSIDGVNLLN
jgi:hypothetical protein